jgi:hypothetical protein
MIGTHNGPLAMGGTELPPTGRSITVVFAVHLWFCDGLVQRERVFYDRLAMLRQLIKVALAGAGGRNGAGEISRMPKHRSR